MVLLAGPRQVGKTTLARQILSSWPQGVYLSWDNRTDRLVVLPLEPVFHWLQDTEGFDVDLRYVRDRTGHEVDFLVTVNRKPWFAVDAKVSDTAIDPSLVYFRDRLKIPFAYQVVLESPRDFVDKGVRCVPAATFLSGLI